MPNSRGMMNFEELTVVEGKKTRSVALPEFLLRVGEGQEVVLDLGAGDGSFAYRYARSHPESLVIGADPARERLTKFSAKAKKKPARGGVSNVFFIVAELHSLPLGFSTLFSGVYILFPWTSLLSAILQVDPDVIPELERVLKPQGRLTILINMQVTYDDRQRIKLGLPIVSEDYLNERLGPGFAAHGLVLEEHALLEPDEVTEASTWRGRLVRGSKRKCLRLIFRKPQVEAGSL